MSPLDYYYIGIKKKIVRTTEEARIFLDLEKKERELRQQFKDKGGQPSTNQFGTDQDDQIQVFQGETGTSIALQEVAQG